MLQYEPKETFNQYKVSDDGPFYFPKVFLNTLCINIKIKTLILYHILKVKNTSQHVYIKAAI